MDQLQGLFTEFTDKVKEALANESEMLDTKRQQVALELKDKLILDQKEKDLLEKEKQLDEREKDLDQRVKLNRERSQMLDLRERKITEERERLKQTLTNLNLENN